MKQKIKLKVKRYFSLFFPPSFRNSFAVFTDQVDAIELDRVEKKTNGVGYYNDQQPTQLNQLTLTNFHAP